MLALLEDAAPLPPLSGFEPPAFTINNEPPLDDFVPLPSTADHFTCVTAPTPTPVAPLEAFATSAHDDACKKEADILADLLRSAPAPVDSDAEANDDCSVEGEITSERDTTGAAPSASSVDDTPAAAAASLSSSASDVTASASAVERAKKAAEDFANGKVSERKRRLKAERDATPEKRRKGNDGSSCSDGDGDAPEKVSHRKYQKRLQKNRDSAYVSRIRRREYTKRLEESLDRVEKEKNDIQTRFDTLSRQFDLVLTELNALKDATARRFKSLAGPVGAAAAVRTPKPKGAGAIVTTMFMCALMFGFCVPESITSRAPWAASLPPGPARRSFDNMQFKFSHASQRATADKGRVWAAIGPLPPPHHWGVDGVSGAKMERMARNMTVVFGAEDGKKATEFVESRLKSMSDGDKEKIMQGAEKVADQCDSHEVARSKRSELLKAFFRKALAIADECITKELIALLTIRLIPIDTVTKASAFM